MKKICTKCKVLKPLDSYHRSSKEKDGRIDRCKECCAEYKREHHAKNRDRDNEINKEWATNNKEKIITIKKEWHKNNPNKTSEYCKKYYKNNLEKRRKSSREYRLMNLEKYRETSRNYTREYRKNKPDIRLLNLYGITNETRNNMISFQNNKCAICGNGFSSTKDAHTDHCHKTSKVRGILCTRCNLMIGCAKDNPTTCRNAADYLEKHSMPTGV